MLQGKGAAPNTVFLVRGSLTHTQLSDLAAGHPSEALGERTITTRTWSDASDQVVAPEEALQTSTRYSLGVVELGEIWELDTPDTLAGMARRQFPEDTATGYLWFCGDRELQVDSIDAALDPLGPMGRWQVGTPNGHARDCMRFEPAETVARGVYQPPILDGIALDPRPVAVDQAPEETSAVCAEGEIPFGPGCARVEDDRLVFWSSEPEIVWVVTRADGSEWLAQARSGEAVVLRGFVPAAVESIEVEWLSPHGWGAQTVDVLTGESRPRPILSEVYANAVGSEPEQEWVELLNDGTAPANLGDLALEDVGGHTPLPVDSGVLEPNEIVLIVGDGFDASGQYDVAPPPEARIVRVAGHLGKNGLSNSGEPLQLVGLDGTVLSRFPAEPKPKQGESVARFETKTGEPIYVRSPPTPGADNGSAPDGSE
ncbi:MAG: lamin tail domain-containing protein [Polyangiaceae bacterium]